MQKLRKFSITDYSIIAVFLLIMLFFLSYVILFYVRAYREHVAITELERYGAQGNDCISLSEMFTGTQVICELYIPATVPRDIAFKYLPDMVNVDTLKLEYENLTPEEQQIIENMKSL